jgi:Raf kinase inhibitor-like YbhB/YbcL family protein
MRVTAAALLAVFLVDACASPEPAAPPEVETDAPDTIEVTSAAFAEGETLPVRFTCDGEDVSPPLSWSNVPEGTEEIVILVQDHDAPQGTFVHWIVAGIDPITDGIDDGEVPGGAVGGTNDFGETDYRGPCPPEGDGPHRYEFVVHALGEASRFDDQADAELMEVLASHTIATGTLTGEYRRDG